MYVTDQKGDPHMDLGDSLLSARKNRGLTQEEVAERLGVSRQTISKWELGETLPDILQSKRLAALFNTTLDELISFDPDEHQVHEAIARTSERIERRIDWTSAWGKRYPVLLKYRDEIDVAPYAEGLCRMLAQIGAEGGYGDRDAMLALKDILYRMWKESRDGE